MKDSDVLFLFNINIRMFFVFKLWEKHLMNKDVLKCTAGYSKNIDFESCISSRKKNRQGIKCDVMLVICMFSFIIRSSSTRFVKNCILLCQ